MSDSSSSESSSSSSSEISGAKPQEASSTAEPASTTAKESTSASNITPKDETSNTATSNNSNSKKNKRKRKQQFGATKAERVLAAKQERYDKLLYLAQKGLAKPIKQIKRYILQKQIKRNPANLSVLKELDLTLVVQQALLQLGLYHANPTEFQTTPSHSATPEQQEWIRAIVDHKQMQAILEDWNEKVTEYRRFCLRLDERNDKFGYPQEQKKKKKKKQKQEIDQNDEEYQDSMFCSLNGSMPDQVSDMEDNPYAAYGPAATEAMQTTVKKNRKGQRARRAKAMAIQAKKEGRKLQQSLNWRSADEKKAKQANERAANLHTKKKPTKTQPSIAKPAAPAAAPAEDTPQHPSWAAKQQQKSGIVAFQGTKITFD